MLRILKKFITEFFELYGEVTEDLFMKLKKLIVFFLNLYFIANMAAETKFIEKEKLIKTLEKNKKTDVVFVSNVDLKGITVFENSSQIIIPSLKSEKLIFISKIETDYLTERLKYINLPTYNIEFVLLDSDRKIYGIKKIYGIESVTEYKTRIEQQRIAEEERKEKERITNLTTKPVQVIILSCENISESEKIWLPSQIQDKLKSNLQTYIGMKTNVDSMSEKALKKLQEESENFALDQNSAIELGKITTAKFALFTKIRKTNDNYVIGIDFTDLTTGVQMASCMSKEYSKVEYLYGNTGAIDELTLALAEKLKLNISVLNINLLSNGVVNLNIDEQLELAKQNEAQFSQMIKNYDDEISKLLISNDLNAIQNKKRLEAEKALLEEKQNSEKKRQEELKIQKERNEVEKKLEEERSIELKTLRDNLAKEAEKKAKELRKLKIEKQNILGQINFLENKKKALVEIRESVEKNSVDLYNIMKQDEIEQSVKILSSEWSSVELKDGEPTAAAKQRRSNKVFDNIKSLTEKFYLDCENVKNSTIEQQNSILSEIQNEYINLEQSKTVSSLGEELKVSFGSYDGEKYGWNAYLSLYSDGILLFQETFIVDYKTLAGKNAPEIETATDEQMKEYINTTDMYNSLLVRGDPVLYFEIDYKVVPCSEDKPSEYEFIFNEIKAINTISNKVVQTSKIDKHIFRSFNPKYDIREINGIVNTCKNETELDFFIHKCMSKGIFRTEDEYFKAFKYLSKFDFILKELPEFEELPERNIKMLSTEVTQEIYTAVMNENPSHFYNNPLNGENQQKRPVEYVSWYDAIYFCNLLSEIFLLTPVYSVNGETDVTQWNYVPHKNVLAGKIEQNLNANGYRLPTVEEWQYAAKDVKYVGRNNIGEVAWYAGNSDSKTHEVGKKKANGYGLFDMCGNVWEWCWDSDSNGYNSQYYCGGCWDFNSYYDRVDDKYDDYAWSQSNRIGFRIVCSLE